MPKTYNECVVQCPFFISCGKRNITCEGITDDCTTFLMFTSKQKRDQHRNIFCENRYKYCELYEVIERKYED